MGMEITEILLSAQSPDGQVRSAAEETLKQFQEQKFPHFLLSLSVELSNDQNPPESRRLAGIILKNSLDAKASNRKEELAQQWVSIDLSIKAQIKDSLLHTLGSSVMEARHTSSQVIAKIAYIEIPRREWQDLIEHLLNNMKQQAAPAALKQATLEALGYVCEEVSYQDLEQEQVNAVLTAVVQGMTQQEHSCEVRLAAVRSLYNALDFAESNFRNEMERNYIMQVVCEAAISKELEIRQAAFECIVSIASMYYDVLQTYMDTLFTLTANAVKGDEEPVALPAIEFCSTICDKEIEIQDTSHFIRKALPLLGPVLLETLLKQEEDQYQDDATWNLSMAGATCLGLVAKTVRDAIVPLVLPFVQDNITRPEWRNREAATFAFGCILEGPCVEKLLPFVVHSGLDYLLKAMEDQNSHVKDTAAWTLGRIFEILHSPNSDYPVITAEKLPHIVTVLMRSIRDTPNVSEKVCEAIYFLAHAYKDAESDSSLLTPYLDNIILALLATADRMDTNSVELWAAAYETLNEIVWCSKVPETETSNIIAKLLLVIMDRLSKTFDFPIMLSDDRVKQRALLCGVLQVIVQKLSGDETKYIILQSADRMMALFLDVIVCGSMTVFEEPMLAIGSLAYAMGPEFANMSRFSEFFRCLLWHLKPKFDGQILSILFGVFGDICRAVDDNILPFCDDIMDFLSSYFRQFPRYPKHLIFSCLGDIALAIGEVHFEMYIDRVLQMLQEAVQHHSVTLDSSDEDMFEYEIQLMRGIFKAYSSILQECKCRKSRLMSLYATHLLKFHETVFSDKAHYKHFEKHIEYVLEMLQGAAENCVTLDSSNKAMLECGNQLRRGIFWIYSGILRVFKSSKTQLKLTLPDATHLLQFTEAVFRDENTDEVVTSAAVAVMGDLGNTLGPGVELLSEDCKCIVEVVRECESDVDQWKETAISIGETMLYVMKIKLGCRFESRYQPFISETGL